LHELPANGCQEPNEMVPKLFGQIRERYVDRPGGYTRVLRIEPMKEDQSESAILELVDGTKDMRFAMTAMTLAQRPARQQFSEKTAEHVKKVTQFRKDGVDELQHMVKQMRIAKKRGIDKRVLPPPRKVYPEVKEKREMHYYDDVGPYKRANPLVIKRGALKRKQTGKVAPSEVKDATIKSISAPILKKSAPVKSERTGTKPTTKPKPQLA
jgi:large subunit ribosomal protein L17